ncbi:hypothetical protein PoB_000420900 [Plakobranchus ocellatus]|uniref:Uncharacterized protein n=1 Tax=Plakobranchus ocellatus TaxID=259542 RepID=A0AAV3Y616_9GAST|nr:hypothetical protein PoB_000420900 [Plakobranchus ocellatus]
MEWWSDDVSFQELLYESWRGYPCCKICSRYTMCSSESDTFTVPTFAADQKVIDYTSSPVYMSQWPRKCHSSQTATSVPSAPGYTFEMTTTCKGLTFASYPLFQLQCILS